ncbi:MAG: Gfo/Idh/MocA family protein [Rubripirellula sp.]
MRRPPSNLSRRAFVGAAVSSTLLHWDLGRRSVAADTILSKKIPIGQIGTTHPHASGKLAAIRGLPDLFELVGVVEENETRREQLSNTDPYRGVQWMTKSEMLSSNVAAVAVETEVTRLVPTGMACIQAGKHIHLDKPAGSSMNDCRQLHAEADERGLTIQMGYMLRYNPAFELLFDIVRKGWLGRITELTAEMGKKGSDTLREELSQYSGGGMFELSCHLIDAMVTVLGKPEQVTAHNRRSYPEKDTFVDNQLAVFDYPNAIATIRCNHLDPFGFPRRHFQVVGEQGMFEINPLEPPKVRLAFDRPRGKFKKGFQDVTIAASVGRYDAEFHDLASVIRGQKKLAWDSTHDLIVHEAVLRGSGMPVD